MTTFMDAALGGGLLADEIRNALDDAIDAWHDADTVLSLHEWLGMTEREYALLVERPDSLPYILKAHRFNTDVAELIRDEATQGTAIAARGASPAEIGTLVEWLRYTARLPS